MSGSLDPGLTVYLHSRGLEEGDTEVGALGNADARAQPALDLALGGVGGVGEPAQGCCTVRRTPPTPASPLLTM